MNTHQTPVKQDGMPSQAESSNQRHVQYSDAAFTPAVDVREDSEGITACADLPGVSRDQLHLHVGARTLTIEAGLALALLEGFESIHTEVGLARFRRSFTLSNELDSEKVSAEMQQGVLHLRMPKPAHAQARRIEVNVE